MDIGGHRKSIAFFIALGACLVALAVTLNIGWIVINWRTGLMLVLGIIFFPLIIAGMVLNTIFLVREIRRNEKHDNFINAMTHELKTPIASIRLYLETLKSRQLDEAKRMEFYDIMLADSDRLLGTIEQVLRAGRVSRSGQRNRIRIELAPMVQECLAIVRKRHHLPPEALNYAGDEHPTVIGDPEDLQAAILNLIDNAIKYSGTQIRVKVEVARLDAKRAAIRVRDQGIGIPGTELKHIFNRFYRIPGMRAKGTGLGLFIVRSVIKKHGGKVYAESEGAGRGSIFTIELPSTPI
jgi:two-component system, OmpR family, sensor histidine kinase SenX3